MVKTISLFILCLVLLFVLVGGAKAVCPVCTVAVGAGVGLSRWLGIDDSVTGLWIGGFLVSLILWTQNWFAQKNVRFAGRVWFLALVYFVLVVAPMYFTGIMGQTRNTFLVFGFRFDKLLMGIIVGSFAFWLGAIAYNILKKNHQGRAHFPFQKVLMPIFPLIILSIVFYYGTR